MFFLNDQLIFLSYYCLFLKPHIFTYRNNSLKVIGNEFWNAENCLLLRTIDKQLGSVVVGGGGGGAENKTSPLSGEFERGKKTVVSKEFRNCFRYFKHCFFFLTFGILSSAVLKIGYFSFYFGCWWWYLHLKKKKRTLISDVKHRIFRLFVLIN